MKINDKYRDLLHLVRSIGRDQSARGLGFTEVIGLESSIYMQEPVVTIGSRKLNYRFMCAEALWILEGSNQVDRIVPYLARLSKYSDNGDTFQGAYGPKVTEQMRYVVDTLLEDAGSRQAVISIWREQPRYSKDIPCTLSLQFLLRNDRLHCVATMRSSDCWLGWPYDVFTFSMIAASVVLYLHAEGCKHIKLGQLQLTAGSGHIYDNDDDKVCALLQPPYEYWEYKAICLSEFNTPRDLRDHLECLRDGRFDDCVSSFLTKELKEHYARNATAIIPA